MPRTVDELEDEKEQRQALEAILSKLRPFDDATKQRILQTAMVFYGFR